MHSCMACCTVGVAQVLDFTCICRVNPTSYFRQNGTDICVCRLNRHVGWLLSGQACRVTRRAHRLRLLICCPEALAVAVRFRRRVIQFQGSRSCWSRAIKPRTQRPPCSLPTVNPPKGSFRSTDHERRAWARRSRQGVARLPRNRFRTSCLVTGQT